MKPAELELAPAPKADAVALKREELPATRDPEALLKYAIDKGSNVETLERIMVVRRELKAEFAKESFDLALAAFQAECPTITKRKAGAKDAYKYAPLEDILETKIPTGESVKELIKRHGFSYTVTTEIETGWIKAIVTIKHAAGHSEKSEFKVPPDTRNPMMNEQQRYGGAFTFATRYAFKGGFGILTADEDLDGRVNRPKPAGPSTLAAPDPALKPLARELWEVLKTVRGAKSEWTQANQWLWKQEILDGAVPEEAPNLSASKFREVIAAARKHLGS